jgi:integrase
VTIFALVGEHGRGGIARRKDGRLQVSITMPNGRRIVRYAGKDRDGRRQRRKAEAILSELIESRERDLYPSEQTLGAFLTSWIEGLPNARKSPRARTIEHYHYVVEDYVIPALGHIRLDRLTPRHVQEWIDADTGSTRSVHHHRAVLRRALNVAKARQLIGDNPAMSVEMPELDDYRGNPLSETEARRLLGLPGRLAPLWRLAIDSGLRISELLGLAWDDLDLDDATLTLRHQLYRDRAGWHLVEPKTTRDVPISLAPSTVHALREHQRRMVEERTPAWEYFGLVFVTPKGQPFGRSEILRAFHAACDEAGIPRRRVHDLRGTSLTFLEDQGIDEATRMRRAGHVTTTMARHYAQSRVSDRAAAEAIERVLG